MKTLIVLAALLLAGCSVGQSEWDRRAMDHTNVAFVGIPTMLGIGFTGTTTPITRGYSFTNKHVAYPTLRRIERTHKACDLALIKQDNTGEQMPPRIGYVPIGKAVTLYGYSGRTMLPVSGRGTVKGVAMRGGCLVGWTDAGSVQGMSGGAVMDDSGALVGIIFGGNISNGYTYFVMQPALIALLGSQTPNAHE